MTDFKFNIDKPGLNDEQINKHKDFKKLIYNYQTSTTPLYKTPLYKNKKVFLVILLILLLTIVIIELIEDKNETNEPPKQEQTK